MAELRLIRYSLFGLLLLHFFGAIYFARELVLPILIAIILALTFSPLVRFLTRRGISKIISAFAITFSIGLLLVSVVILVAVPISDWLSDLPRLENDIRAKLASVTSSVEAVRDVANQVEEMATEATESDPLTQTVTVDQPQFLTTAASGAVAIVTTMAISLLLSLFFLMSNDLIPRKLSQISDTQEQRKRALDTIADIEVGLSRYLLSISAINLGLGLCVWLGLELLGLSDAWIWGVIAFLLNFIPFLGAILGSAFVFGIAIVQFDTVGQAALAPAIYLALSSIEGQFVTPSLVGRRMEINAISVILTVFVWGWLWGIPGMIIAVPFLVIIKSIADNLPVLEKLSILLSNDADHMT